MNKSQQDGFDVSGFWLDKLEHEFKTPNIGQLIEFLGDDLMAIREIDDIPAVELGEDYDFKQFEHKELADALWEACKVKLS